MEKMMKRTCAIFAMVMMLMMASNTAQAQCSGAVDKLCKAFDLMKGQVNAITDIDGLENLDFDKSIAQSGIESIPDECGNYKLTAADKTKLRKSYNGFCDAMTDKLYSFVAGVLTKKDVAAQMEPMKTAFDAVLESSDTLGDFIGGLDMIFSN